MKFAVKAVDNPQKLKTPSYINSTKQIPVKKKAIPQKIIALGTNLSDIPTQKRKRKIEKIKFKYGDKLSN
jgi:hypothetical protein